MMFRTFTIIVFLTLISINLVGQSKRILHYSETSGFDHQTRANSLSMFQSFQNLVVIDDQDGSSFDSLNFLLSFDLIVFSNTSGSNILDSTQRSHFEKYIQNGGHFLGIHAATDTYRHSSANGSSTGIWDFYAETVGGSVQQNPNHVAGTPFYNNISQFYHPTLHGIPNPWGKNEEYYYWENGYLDSNINVVLKVEQTIGPNGLSNSYDSARAVSWVKTLNSGSRIFYTSMGHSNSNYISDSLFIKHIENATMWCLGISNSVNDVSVKNIRATVYPNPSDGKFYIDVDSEIKNIKVFNPIGKSIPFEVISNYNKLEITVNQASGIYFIEYVQNHSKKTFPILIKSRY